MDRNIDTKAPMDSMQGIIDKFNDLTLADNGGSLGVEEAGVVIAFMVATVMAVMERGVDLDLLEKVVEALEPFHFRHVAGADMGRRYGGCVRDIEVNIDDEERKVRNTMDDQIHHFTQYQYRLEWSLTDVRRLPLAQQTKEQLRSIFLRIVAETDDDLNIVTDLNLQQGIG